MRHKVAIFLSTLTGNTKKLADEIQALFSDKGWKVVFCSSSDDADDADLLIFCFWCRRSSMDDWSLGYLDPMQGRRILACGTMGGDSAGAYGLRVRENVRAAIEANNSCEGIFTCRGSVNMERIARRRRLSPEDPHYVSEEKYAQLLSGQGHPDEGDLSDLRDFIEDYLKKAGWE